MLAWRTSRSEEIDRRACPGLDPGAIRHLPNSTGLYVFAIFRGRGSRLKRRSYSRFFC